MADEDIVRELANGRHELEEGEFRSFIPDWPGWIRVRRESPGFGCVWMTVSDYTNYDARHYSLHMQRTNEDEEPSITLYGTTYGLFTDSSIPLHDEKFADVDAMRRRAPLLRSELPKILLTGDLSKLGKDGEIDAYDRQFEGARLLRKPYYEWDENWMHDHCVFCCATFSLRDPGALTEGYAVQDDPKYGDDYNWICVECLNKRRGLIHYDIIGE